mmetsp:Transcript_77767/g.175828  ORF Transcript_77767/g.175828 Transcript_77767/m.175828 type:complete len:241 (+) Transcript_77767:111-833(+)
MLAWCTPRRRLPCWRMRLTLITSCCSSTSVAHVASRSTASPLSSTSCESPRRKDENMDETNAQSLSQDSTSSHGAHRARGARNSAPTAAAATMPRAILCGVRLGPGACKSTKACPVMRHVRQTCPICSLWRPFQRTSRRFTKTVVHDSKEGSAVRQPRVSRTLSSASRSPSFVSSAGAGGRSAPSWWATHTATTARSGGCTFASLHMSRTRMAHTTDNDGLSLPEILPEHFNRNQLSSNA